MGTSDTLSYRRISPSGIAIQKGEAAPTRGGRRQVAPSAGPSDIRPPRRDAKEDTAGASASAPVDCLPGDSRRPSARLTIWPRSLTLRQTMPSSARRRNRSTPALAVRWSKLPSRTISASSEASSCSGSIRSHTRLRSIRPRRGSPAPVSRSRRSRRLTASNRRISNRPRDSADYDQREYAPKEGARRSRLDAARGL